MRSFFSDTKAILEDAGADWFAPARPRPPTARLATLSLLRAARRSLLSIWNERSYETHCGERRLMGRQVVLVNAPEAIKYVMVAAHENYQRKSPQMRRAHIRWRDLEDTAPPGRRYRA